MKKIIAFAGSNSKKSINKQLVTYASSLLGGIEVSVLDLNDYPLPIYGIDKEIEEGVPENAAIFLEKIKEADGIAVSLAEHNGNFTVAFKNIIDWMSRIEQKIWHNKPMLLLSTSPGGRGGASSMAIAKNGFPHMGANVIADFSLPKFYDNFNDGRIVNEEFNEEIKEAVTTFQKAV
ncbi:MULTISPECIES: NADPH-dependent FMN reductase [Tenacibaculum]|uniref:NADPH-dependent oxidoreductase n=1 Tax=Tenacibaculum mesophilum TaxID=104268 RepID=A0ABM7CC94_9FLAO|nr:MULTISPECIES: NAD(P)H-dependent oxidoreductase [Tenacibaculum]AZJ31364.1 NADPH-dependent oxidoreductase [Tenacibaculum mesophilum]KAF9660421.1 NAD(P)H-dependent oxidoreductase [Tenacibaculum mesophilum]MCO7186603.1 NAD(P)H-dependent oxidoreductase [Tenacibaculum sp. XPcli2-G]QFS29412.1 NADPH-dependent FMN reductase [Tenacibaculum mesophilum]SHF97120.1 NAD(P)H-dependent FMN reductase [Tenacibaculum mesophilum]